MKDYMRDRMLTIAEYILTTSATVRACADHFKVSKTTVHKDMTHRLKNHNPARGRRVRGYDF